MNYPHGQLKVIKTKHFSIHLKFIHIGDIFISSCIALHLIQPDCAYLMALPNGFTWLNSMQLYIITNNACLPHIYSASEAQSEFY